MKTKMKKYAALFCALCTVLVVISGCGNLNDPYSLPQRGGEGTLILNISDGSSNGRTIVPAPIAFTQYRVTIKNHGTQDEAYTKDYNPGDPIFIELPNGYYDVFVDGLVGEAIVAEGKESNVQLSHGNPRNITIALAAIMNNGEGTFAWDLTFHGSITAAVMQIKQQGANVGASVDVKANNTGSNATLTLDAGQYEVLFTLTVGGKTIIWSEDMHIYRGLTSIFEYEFEDLSSETLAKTVENAIKAENTTGITQNHFILLGIDGVTGSNVNALLGAIEWVEDLATSVDIALIRIHTWAAYHEEADLVDAINAVMKNGTEVEVDDVTVDPVALTATFLIEGKTITISGFTFTDAKIIAIEVGTKDQQKDYFKYYQYYSTPDDLDELAAALAVMATYSKNLESGSNKAPIDLYTISPGFETINFDTARRVEFTVTATGTDPLVTTTFEIDILPLRSITTNEASLAIEELRRDYYQYIEDEVDLEEVVVTGHWGSADNLIDHEITGKIGVELYGIPPYFDFDIADEHTITIIYHDKETEIKVTVHPLVSLVIPATSDSNTIPTEASIKDLITSGSLLVKGDYDIDDEYDGIHAFNAGFVALIIDDIGVTLTPVSTVAPLTYNAQLTWNRTAPLPAIVSNECLITVTATPVVDHITVVDESGPFYQYVTDFNSDGVTVWAHYTLGKPSEDVTDDADTNIVCASTSDVFKTESRQHTVNVTYGSVSTSYTVMVIGLTDLVIEGVANNDVYSDDPTEEQVLTKVTNIEAVYADEFKKSDIGKDDITVTVNAALKTITIRWHQKSNVYSYQLKALASIAVTGSVGSQYQYIDFDPTGLTVTATYNDNSTGPVALGDVIFTGYNAATSGSQTITASIGDVSSDDPIIVDVIALESIEILGVNATYTAHPEKSAIIAAYTVNAVYVGGHKIPIKGLLNNDTDVVVNDSVPTSGTVTVTWNGMPGTANYTIVGGMELNITVAQFYDVNVQNLNFGDFTMYGGPYTVTLSGTTQYDLIKWTLNGAPAGTNNSRTFAIPLDKDTKIGPNVLKVEIVLDGKTYSKNIVYNVSL